MFWTDDNLEIIDRSVNGQRIVCAANKYNNGRIILGVRHFDELMRMQLEAEPDTNWKSIGHIQGFVCNKKLFHTREDAYVIAKAANQIIKRCGGDDNKLFSENLY